MTAPLVAPVAGAAPSEPPPSFQSSVERVTVDAVVVDRKGQPVRGLTRDDFVVSENGVRQPIASFEEVVVPDGAPSPPDHGIERVSTNAAPESRVRGRSFVVVFDDVHLSPQQAQRAKGAVAAFLEKTAAPGDVVTLVASGGGAWWTARMPEGRPSLVEILNRLDGRYVPDPSPDRITEFEAMRIELHQDEAMALRVKRRFDAYGTAGQERAASGPAPADAPRAGSAGTIPEVVRLRAREVFTLAESRKRITLGVMARAIRSQAAIKGRKSMLLVSQGFVYDPQSAPMRDVVTSSRRHNVPVYFVDTRGLQALPEAFTAAFGLPTEVQDVVAVLADLTRDAEGAEALALDTGGFVVKNSNDLVGGMARVAAESRAYYLLGYDPSDVPHDGRFRRIEVTLQGERRRGLRVRARRGYFAPLDGMVAGRDERDPVIGRALDAPFEIPDVPLRAASYVFDEAGLDRLNVQLAVEIDVRALRFEPSADGSLADALAFVVEAQHRESGEWYRYDQKIELALRPETKARLDRSWYGVAREFTLPPGGYQARIVVRDLGSGRVGSLVHEFEVPGGGALRLSTPILSDAVETAPDGSRRPLLRVARSFTSGSTLWCQFGVYGAARSQADLLPRVSARYEVRDRSGALLMRSDPSPIQPTSVGALLRLSGISLTGAAPGEYELVLTVEDELAGRAATAREPFAVAAPDAPAAALTGRGPSPLQGRPFAGRPNQRGQGSGTTGLEGG